MHLFGRPACASDECNPSSPPFQHQGLLLPACPCSCRPAARLARPCAAARAAMYVFVRKYELFHKTVIDSVWTDPMNNCEELEFGLGLEDVAWLARDGKWKLMDPKIKIKDLRYHLLGDGVTPHTCFECKSRIGGACVCVCVWPGLHSPRSFLPRAYRQGTPPDPPNVRSALRALEQASTSTRSLASSTFSPFCFHSSSCGSPRSRWGSWRPQRERQRKQMHRRRKRQKRRPMLPSSPRSPRRPNSLETCLQVLLMNEHAYSCPLPLQLTCRGGSPLLIHPLFHHQIT
jgi:hypothetical protein